MNREDASAVPWMAKFRRDPAPKKVVWHQDDVTHDRFYWLAVEPGQASGGVDGGRLGRGAGGPDRAGRGRRDG